MSFFSKFKICLVVVTLVTAFFCFHYSVTLKAYPQYPWWHQLDNDIDGAHVATTVSLVNGERFEFVYHPAVTLFQFHGVIYRLRALVDPTFHEQLYLTKVENLSDAMNQLELPTRFSRYLLILTHILLTIAFFVLFYQISNKAFLSVLGSLLLSISKWHFQHLIMIRAEDLSLLFLVLSAIFLVSFAKRSQSIKLVLAGLMLGLALFSKIQVIPMIALSVGIFSLFLLFKLDNQRDLSVKQFVGWFVFAGVVTPWWAFWRPGFLDESFFRSLSRYSDLWKVYGKAPDHCLVIPVGLFLAVLFFYLVGKVFKVIKLRQLSLALLFIILGGMGSIYTLFLPISTSWNQYVENTRHTVYATGTNTLDSGFLQDREVNPRKWENVFAHINRGKILNIPFASLLFIVIIATLSQIGFKVVQRQDIFVEGVILLVIITTGGMDLLAAMRAKSIYSYYSIYSFTFYGMAMLLFLNAWWNLIPFSFHKMNIFQMLILSLLTTHLILQSYHYLQQPAGRVELVQNPLAEMQNIRAHAQPFLRVVDQKILQNRSSL